jgi:ketosteroid isomerase-like protein
MSDAIEDEVRATFHRYIETRDAIDRGELPWKALEKYFTEDAVFIDPAWGRIEGLQNVREFWVKSMTGLEDWKFPEVWTQIEGRRVVTMWMQKMGKREDGTDWECPGISILYYAGDGKFCYEMDIMNMAHVIEIIRDMGWTPPPNFSFPPATVDRNIALPKGREQLAKGD